MNHPLNTIRKKSGVKHQRNRWVEQTPPKVIKIKSINEQIFQDKSLLTIGV